IMLYNDAEREVVGARHPRALGQPAVEVIHDMWDQVGPMLHGVLDRGEANWFEDRLLFFDRSDYVEQCYFTFSYSPIPVDGGGIGGVLMVTTETTERVIRERRLKTLGELSARSLEAKTVEEACRIAADTLRLNPYDFPFALIYLCEPGRREGHLLA